MSLSINEIIEKVHELAEEERQMLKYAKERGVDLLGKVYRLEGIAYHLESLGDVPVQVKVICQECGSEYEWEFRTPHPVIVTNVKLAASEQRRRDVARMMKACMDVGGMMDVSEMKTFVIALLDGVPESASKKEDAGT